MIAASNPIALIHVRLPLGHLTPTGLGPWGDGMARLILEPTDLLLMIALVLLAAQSGRACSDRLPLLLPLAWLCGGLIGLALREDLLLAVPATAVVLLAGVLVASGARLPTRLLLPLAACLTLLFSVVAGSTIGGHPGAAEALLGETVGVAVLVTLLSQAVAPPQPHWLEIAMRVAGSWIGAASLLMLGWLVRHPG